MERRAGLPLIMLFPVAVVGAIAASGPADASRRRLHDIQHVIDTGKERHDETRWKVRTGRAIGTEPSTIKGGASTLILNGLPIQIVVRTS